MTIRNAEQKDVEQILAIYSPFISDSAVTFETSIPSLEEFRKRIAKVQESMPWIVALENNKVVGYAYAGNHRQRECYQWTKELSVYLSPEAKGKGIARKLYDQLIAELKTLGINNVLAGITMTQKESIQFHEKYGFNKVGVYHSVGFKLGKWQDVGWWELKINDNQPPK